MGKFMLNPEGTTIGGGGGTSAPAFGFLQIAGVEN